MLDRQRSAGYSLLGDIHAAQGSVENAKADLQAAIDRNPREVANYLALDTLYEKEGNWERAKKVCERAHQVNPDSPLVANNLAYLYLEDGGDVNVALSLAQGARQKMLDSPTTADTLGWLLQIRIVRVGCRAIKEMRSARSEKPHIPVSLGYGLYGRSSFRLGRAVSAEGTTGRSKFPGCSECQGSLGQDFERPKIVISPGPTYYLRLP